MIEAKDIPYSDVRFNGRMSIQIPRDVKKLPPVFNELTDEVTSYLSIDHNPYITSINMFNSLTRVGGYLSIDDNKSITSVTGFNNLTQVVGSLWIRNNPKLVAMSIPGSMVRSVDYSKPYYGIRYDNDSYFTSPPEFINSPVVIDDLVLKFNPVYHNTQVINQIIENLEEWGTEDTKEKVISNLISKGGKHLIPQEYLNKYHLGTIKNNNKIITDYLEMSN